MAAPWAALGLLVASSGSAISALPAAAAPHLDEVVEMSLPAAQDTAARDATAPAQVAAALPLDRDGAEYHVAAMINELRAIYALRPLAVDVTLIQMARERSQDMAERKYFGHQIPGIGFAPEWIRRQLPRAIGIGETLGLSIENGDSFVPSLFRAWLASPTHLENMVRPEFNRVGIGVVEVPSRIPGVTLKYVTQLFAIASGPLQRA